MEIIRGLYNLRPRHRGCVATIGNFDGVHLGHQMLLRALADKGAALALPTCLITFEPQPREYFRGAMVPARLTRFREKATLLAQCDLDRVLCLPFNDALANTSAQQVVDDMLVDGLAIKHLVVGDDFRFGADRSGDFAMLQGAGRKHGFTVNAMGTLRDDDDRVSSTLVREALAAGAFAQAEQYLGRPYFIMGRVVYGRQLGRQLGVPTVNIPLQRYQAALQGVYVVDAEVHPPAAAGGALQPPAGQRFHGVANIGVRPTVDGHQPMLEVHLLDCNQHLYGQLITVTFRHKLRDEHKFPDLEALKTQIQLDIKAARSWAGEHLQPLVAAGLVT